MSNLLNIKDQNGNWIPIPVITNGIQSITQNQDYTLTITLNDGTTYTTTSIKGEDGQDYILTENDKQEIAGLVDIPVEDVQINGTSIVSDGIAEIPVGGADTYGVYKANGGYGITNYNGFLRSVSAPLATIRNGVDADHPIVSQNQHQSVFYGLAKASGDTTQSQSSNAIGTYTDDAKASIQSMLGVPSEDDVITDVQVNGSSVVSDGVANISIPAPDPKGMVVKTTLVSGNQYTIDSTYDTIKATLSAGINVIVMAQNIPQPYVGNIQMDGVWYLAFGVSTTYNNYATLMGFLIPETYQNIAVWVEQSVHIPTLDDSDIDANIVWSSSKISNELSQKVGDVQIDGTSVVENGVANISIANTKKQIGGIVAKSPLWSGITFTDSGAYLTLPANTLIKAGTDNSRTSLIHQQHLATFYGLAKAAGADEKDSTLPVGQYTDSAKTAIKNMLGIIDNGGTISETVTGTDPVITAQSNFRYMCGELYTLDFTPCASGVCEVIFTSGTTPTVLTLPNTVRMPDWWSGVETNTTYEISIVDGVWGAVMSWS